MERQQGGTEDQNAEQVRRFLDSAKQPHFTLKIHGCHETVPLPLDRLLADNAEDAELCAWLRSAPLDSGRIFGGGAAPMVSIRRVS